jgi:mono/diheme cytochrome c family protein
MRERMAKGIIVLALSLLTGLSFVFARLHNRETPGAPDSRQVGPPASSAPEAKPGLTEADLAPARDTHQRGRAVYGRERCATCHSIAGEGNPRFPLDGVAARWKPEELEDWIIGSGVAADLLPTGVVRRKQRYRTLPEEDMKPLIRYLSTLTPNSGNQRRAP